MRQDTFIAGNSHYPQMAKSERTKLKQDCLRLAKKIARKRDGYQCVRCGRSKGRMHASHVIPVSHDERLAVDSRNIKVLCYRCHFQWWHLHPCEAGPWYRNKYRSLWKYLSGRHRRNKRLKPAGLKWWRSRHMELLNEWERNRR